MEGVSIYALNVAMVAAVTFEPTRQLQLVRMKLDISSTASIKHTVVWEKFTVGYFRVKFVHGEIFLSLGVYSE